MAAPRTGNPPNNNIAFYYQQKGALINGSPPAVRGSIEAVFDGRIRERVAQVVPQHQQILVPASFLTLQDTQTVFNLIIPQDPQWANTFLAQSPALVDRTVNSVVNTPALQALLEDWKDSVVTLVMGAGGLLLALQRLAVVRFTATGVAGSLAAIGIVAAGSLFAWLQSIVVGALTGGLAIALAALGTLTGGLALVAIALVAIALGVITLVAIAAGITSYGIYKWVNRPTPEQRLVAFLGSLLNDHTKRNNFWGTIGV